MQRSAWGLDPPNGLNLAVDALPKLIAHVLLGPLSGLLAHELLTPQRRQRPPHASPAGNPPPGRLCGPDTFLAARLREAGPFASLFFRIELHDRVATDKFLGLGKRTVDDRSFTIVELDLNTLG